ncbi:MAG: glucose-6-phosphate isomerase, partial [Gammaproteobacteria bacterium]|nr:glucose-6-phosphate isomerase [Gammaproteobacteria bacterium]
MSSPTKTLAWQALRQHYQQCKHIHLRDLFAQDDSRGDKFSLSIEGMLLDYSKNLITDETMGLLVQLARE